MVITVLVALFLCGSLLINRFILTSRSGGNKSSNTQSSAVLPPAPEQELIKVNIKAESSIKEFIVTRGMVEGFVAARGRSAASLLTAGLTLGFSDFLQEAAQKYPDNPHVAMAIFAEDCFPDVAKAQWAETLILRDPDNRVGYILMANLDIFSGKKDDGLEAMKQSLDATGYNTYYQEELISLKDFVMSAGGSDNDAAKIFYQAKKSADAPKAALPRVIVETTNSIVKHGKLDEDMNDSITALFLLGDDLRTSPKISTIDEKLLGADLNFFLCHNLIKEGLQNDDLVVKTLDRANNERVEIFSLEQDRKLIVNKNSLEELQRFYQLVSQFGEFEALRRLKTMPYKMIK